MTNPHEPVLTNEIVALFEDVKISFFFDGTLGSGGHACHLLAAHPEIERYIGCDRDAIALGIAREHLRPWQEKLYLVQGSYSNMDRWLGEANISCVQGILIDAGVSSMQLDQPERGFSFQNEGPLDMRMDQTAPLSAYEIVNHWNEREIARILFTYGEEPRARAIARAIVIARAKREIQTTRELVEVIRPHVRGKKHLHPATLTFQALRIAVNDELNELERGIKRGIDLLCPLGKIAVIAFQRLEDRIAKNCIRAQELRPKRGTGSLRILTKKPIVPSFEEIKRNPRCRSAKLRAAQKE